MIIVAKSPQSGCYSWSDSFAFDSKTFHHQKKPVTSAPLKSPTRRNSLVINYLLMKHLLHWIVCTTLHYICNVSKYVYVTIITWNKLFIRRFRGKTQQWLRFATDGAVALGRLIRTEKKKKEKNRLSAGSRPSCLAGWGGATRCGRRGE